MTGFFELRNFNFGPANPRGRSRHPGAAQMVPAFATHDGTGCESSRGHKFNIKIKSMTTMTTLRKIMETARDTAVAALGLGGLCCLCSVEQAQTAGTALGLTAAAFALAAAAVLLARTSAHGERSRNYDDFPGED